MVWSDDGLDNLYRAAENYLYSVTESLWDALGNRAIRSIDRTFNRFHLLTLEETTQNDNVLRNQTLYHVLPGVEFEHQPAYCQLPKTASQTWYSKNDPAHQRTENVATTYDDFGNLLVQVNANGVTETSTWYSAEGELDTDGSVLCPKDPQGFVRNLKSKTITPAASPYGAAPELSTRSRYSEQRGLSGHGPWLALRDETVQEAGNPQPLQVSEFTYIDKPDDLVEHGRKLRETLTLNGKTTITGYQYSSQHFARTNEAVLQTLSETIGFDDDVAEPVRKQITLLDSLIIGESVRSRDDANVEIDSEFDSLRRVTKETVAPNSAQYTASRTYTYTLTNALGQRAKQTACDVKGVRTESIINGLGNVIEEYRQDADAADFDRDAEPRLIYQASYDNREQKVSESVIDWEGSSNVVLTHFFKYDDWNEASSVIRPDGVEEFEVNDPIARTVTQWLGIKDPQGRDKALRGKTVTTNNLFDQPDTVHRYHLDEDPATPGARPYSEHLNHYDGLGRTAEEFDAAGNWTTYEYDWCDRMIRTRLPDYTEVEREYAEHSSEDLPITISVNGRVLGRQVFDGLDRMVKSITGGRESLYTFDPGQTQPKRVRRPSGLITGYSYVPELSEDPQQRIAVESTAHYEYDAENARLHRTEEVDEEGVTHNIVREYFSTGEIRSERREQRRANEQTPFESYLMTYDYSRQGRLLSYEDVLGQTQTYTYDEKSARLIATALGTTRSTFAYDDAGELARIETRDGEQMLVTELEYDEFGREQVRRFLLGDGITQTLAQSYDEVDRLTQRTLTQQVNSQPEETLRDETYSYDERGRLVYYECRGSQPPQDPYGKMIKSQIFNFDAQDNLDFVETTFEGGRHSIFLEHLNEDDPCQLTGLRNELSPPQPDDPNYPPRNDFTYDDDGNMLNDLFGHFMQYDSLDRLVSVSAPAGSDLRYNALDQLTEADNDGTREQRFYRGDELVNRRQGDATSTVLLAQGKVLAEHQAGVQPKPD